MNTENIPVVILCGGRGTRMGNKTESVPKPLLKIGNFPILWHIMKLYGHFNYNNFFLALGYKGNLIKEYLINYEKMLRDFRFDLRDSKITFLDNQIIEPWNIALIDTGKDTLTASRILKLKNIILKSQSPVFAVTYGDGIGNINLKKLLNFHLKHKKIATITGVCPPSRFGELSTKGNKVVFFNEKPQVSGSYINGGFFIFDTRRIWKYLDIANNLALEQEPLTNLSRDRQLMVFKHAGFWQPMDTPREHDLLNSLWHSNDCPWKFILE